MKIKFSVTTPDGKEKIEGEQIGECFACHPSLHDEKQMVLSHLPTGRKIVLIDDIVQAKDVTETLEANWDGWNTDDFDYIAKNAPKDVVEYIQNVEQQRFVNK